MVENKAEGSTSSTISRAAHELLRPFGSEAYKQSREAGEGRFKSTINGLTQALMPATYSMIEHIRRESPKEGAKLTSKDKNSIDTVGATFAVAGDLWTNLYTLTLPGIGWVGRYVWGQVMTRTSNDKNK